MIAATIALSGRSDGCVNPHSINAEQVSWIEVKKVLSGGDSETATANSRHDQVADWLGNNRCGWDEYCVTLPAPDIIIGGNGFALYLKDGSIFLGQRDKSMLVKRLSDDEYQQFLEMLFVSDH